MINSKITTDIMTTTGSTIDIPPAKVVINNQEITDLETFNKVVDSIKEKDKEIERLNNNWEELEKYLEEQSLYGFPTECGIYRTVLNKLKELKGSVKNENNK